MFFILIYIQQDTGLRSLFYLENYSTGFGWYDTHHQEHKQLYLQHLVYVTPLLLPAAIAAGSSKGVTIPDTVDTVVCAPDDGCGTTGNM